MAHWKELTQDLEGLLRLRTFPIAYKRLENASDLESIRKVRRLDRYATFCQVPGLVRTRGWTIGITLEDSLNDRCTRIHGLAEPTDKSKEDESAMLSTTWFKNPEEAMIQQNESPRIPKGGAIVLAPLASEKFDPDVILIYANPAQIMMLLCGLQKMKFEYFKFGFIGEGACADSLAQCYVSGQPSVGIPCFGERRFGEVLDDEIVIGLPPDRLEIAIEGLRQLSAVGMRYPIPIHGAECDPLPSLARAYGG